MATFDLTGRVAVVTSAGKGLSRAMALAAEGYISALHYEMGRCMAAAR